MEKPTRRWTERLEQFSKALSTLERAFAIADERHEELSELERDGVIQRFEFTVELAWKTLQDLLAERGYADVKGPKAVLKQSFQDGIITDGHRWIQMIDSRNESTHLYDEERSEQIFHAIATEYIQLLRSLREYLRAQAAIPL
jgi:nucleotidyltransferase substrate binding protein (TIGR01987 family)